MACATALKEVQGLPHLPRYPVYRPLWLRNAQSLQSQSELRFANPRAGDSALGGLGANSHELPDNFNQATADLFA